VREALVTQPSHPFIIKELLSEEIPKVVAVLESLRQFFPEEAIPMIEFSLKEHHSLAGCLNEDVVSFLVYELRDSKTAEIMWMGVLEEYHGLGLGTMMLDYLEQMLKRRQVSQLVTSTLSYTVPYKPYEKVRTFFYHRGFKALGIQSNYYEEGIDRLILVKQI
jgi:ribosomal protein S18 acetylase RimI-like enzyme